MKNISKTRCKISVQDMKRRDEGVDMVAGVKWFMSKIVLAVLGMGVLSCGLFSEHAGASQIEGSASFSGAVATAGDSSSGTTTISFVNPGWTVVSGLGNYVMSGTSATFTAFSFTGTGTGVTLSGSGIPEGTFTLGTRTYSFELLALVSATTTSGGMFIYGAGIAHITGFDDTPVSWALEGSGHDFTFDLSASTTTIQSGRSTPDGGSAAGLLGIVLVGIEALRRRLRSA